MSPLRGLALKMDADKDGSVTEEELQRWLEKNHIQYIVRRAKQFFVDTDEDDDGFVSFEEYEKTQYEGSEFDCCIVIVCFQFYINHYFVVVVVVVRCALCVVRCALCVVRCALPCVVRCLPRSSVPNRHGVHVLDMLL